MKLPVHNPGRAWLLFPGRARLLPSRSFALDHGSAGASPYPDHAERGFTMIEIAIALAVIAFALVAIIGVLPIGLNVQRDNRAETIINQDATYWLEAIRGGAQGLDDLMNYVESITIYSPNGSNVFMNADLPGATPPTFASGSNIIGLLSNPTLGWTNVAIVRALSGPATEKSTTANASGAELAFRYRMTCRVQAVNINNTVSFNDALALPPPNPPEPLASNNPNSPWALFEIQLGFHWPIFGNNTQGSRGKTYRSMASRYLWTTNDASTGIGYYFLTP